MPWTGVLAVGALLFVQGAFVAACLYAYTRIRSQQDTQGQQRETWSAQLNLAVTTADTAKRMAETIEVEHFRRLRSLYEVQAGELAEAKARITSLEKELKVCQMKLASEERINRRDDMRQRKKEAAEAPASAGEPTGSGDPGVDALLRERGIPLAPQSPAAPAALPSTFGRTAKAKGG